MQRQPEPHRAPLAPHSIQFFLAEGSNALAAGDHRRAEFCFRRVVQSDPLSIEGWKGLAETQVGSRRAICLCWVEYASAMQAVPSAANPAEAREYPVPRRVARGWLISAATASLLGLGLIGSDVAYHDRVLPGVHVGQLDLGSLPLATAAQQVREQQRHIMARSVEVRAGDTVQRTTLGALLSDSSIDAVSAIQHYGHDPAFMSRAASRLRALSGTEHHVDLLAIDTRAVRVLVSRIAAEIHQERRDAQVVFTGQSWVVVPELPGRSIHESQAAALIEQSLASELWNASTEPISVPLAVTHVEPHRTMRQLEPVRRKLEELRGQPLDLLAGDQRWTLDRSLLVAVDARAPELPPSPLLIRQQIEQLAGEFNLAPQPSQLVREGEHVQAMLAGRPGRELDREVAIQRIADAVRQDLAAVELPLREVPPPPGEIEQLGITAEIGRGESQFASYSSPDRDANVATGGQDVSGTLIAPGELFSFNATVGEISWEKGYRWGEAIEAGSVVPSLGGGICQVSTTVFRAAFWSGLEIVERHPHSWRLPWYEVDAPAGMDATIALGGPDLKFRNNTQHHILVMVETDMEHKRQTARIFGTPDGRIVEMQPANDGTISIQRSVLQGATIVAADTFMSQYSQ